MNRFLQSQFFLFLALLAQTAVGAALPDFTGMAREFGPAVVNISTVQNAGSNGSGKGYSLPDLPEDSPLREFFRHFFDENGNGKGMEPPGGQRAKSLGSGFFISKDGFILTNYHVIKDADEVLVRTTDRREFKAEVVGSDRRSDIALLKVDIQDAATVKIGSAKDLQVGEWVLAIGSPFGFDHSVTAGIVSAKRRSLPSENYVPFIQTDVAINPGNSGGPLIDLDGNVVGVNSQIYSRTGGFMGLSFAVPIDLAMSVVDQLRTKGKVSRGWLGVMIQDVTRELAETFGMQFPRGALVAQVLPDSPAQQAGIQTGDVILAFNDQPVHTSASLPPLVGASPVDRASKLELLRDGEQMTLDVVIGELPEEEQQASIKTKAEAKSGSPLNIQVRDLNREERAQLGISAEQGVLVEKVAPGPAASAGMKPGDVILKFASKSVRNVQGLAELVDSVPAGKAVAVLIQRQDGRLFMALKMPE